MINGQKVLSIVMSRPNSQGLPGKSYRRLCGLPLTEWSVVASLNSKYVDLTVMSMSCQRMQDMLSHYSFRPNYMYDLRPVDLSGAKVKNEEVIKYILELVKKERDFEPDIIVNLQSTSPVRNENLLDRCLDMYIENDADSLLTVQKILPFMWTYKQGRPQALYDILNRPMRQDIPDDKWMYFDNGNIYMMNPDMLKSLNCRIGINPALFETTQFQSLQVDTIDDFELIEAMAHIKGSVV